MFLFHLVNAMEVKKSSDIKEISNKDITSEIKEKLSLEEVKINNLIDNKQTEYISHTELKSQISARDPKIVKPLFDLIDKYSLMNISTDKQKQDKAFRGLSLIKCMLENDNSQDNSNLSIALPILESFLDKNPEEKKIIEPVYIDITDISKFNETLMNNTEYKLNYNNIIPDLRNVNNLSDIFQTLKDKYYHILTLFQPFFNKKALYTKVNSDDTDLYKNYIMQSYLCIISVIMQDASKIFTQKNTHLFTTMVYTIFEELHNYLIKLSNHIMTSWVIEPEEKKYQKYYTKPVDTKHIDTLCNMIYDMKEYILSCMSNMRQSDQGIKNLLITIRDYLSSMNQLDQIKNTIDTLITNTDSKQNILLEELYKLGQSIDEQKQYNNQLLQDIDIIIQNQQLQAQIDQEQNTKLAQSEKERLTLKQNIQNNLEELQKSEQKIINQMKQNDKSIVKQIADSSINNENKLQQYDKKINEKINEITRTQDNIVQQTTEQKKLLKQSQLEQNQIKKDIQNQRIINTVTSPIINNPIKTNTVVQQNNIKNTIKEDNKVNEESVTPPKEGVFAKVKNTFNNIGTSISNTASKIWDYLT